MLRQFTISSVCLMFVACDAAPAKDAGKTAEARVQAGGDMQAGGVKQPDAVVAAAPMGPDDVGAYPLPTDAEKREAEIPAYVSVVADPSPSSTLPCPAGTSQKGDAKVIECRVAGEQGVSLSKRQGPSVWFHDNGKVKRAGSYEAHEWHGRWWSFDDQGRPESSDSYKNGKEDGVSVTFYPNGKRRSEIAYVDGKRHGAAKSWTEDGELMGLDVYENDVRVSSKTFRFTMKTASADEMKKMQDDLQAVLAEQKALVEKQKESL